MAIAGYRFAFFAGYAVVGAVVMYLPVFAPRTQASTVAWMRASYCFLKSGNKVSFREPV